ncbi:ogr/Delta-like zinc finger family protein [Salmonella enterica]|nr:ogr/Delta-like zinc finger family protein [Salmonella enterica]ELM3527098.1 ogr/Delta-like zinc finger family protein [Salmonella enterica]
MFPCPLCGASSRTRTSRMEDEERTIRRSVYQCNNPECGVSFHTLQSFEKFVGKNKKDIPWEDLPASHRGRKQLNLELENNAPPGKNGNAHESNRRI